MAQTYSSGNVGNKQPQRRRARQATWQTREACGEDLSEEVAFKPYHSVTVPKRQDLQHASHDAKSKPKTTAMLRNIPNRYTQATLMQELDAVNFQGSYNFFYLPMDTHNRTNVGYAFINFVNATEMTRFTDTFSGYRFKDYVSQKIARVSPAHLQGFDENVAHFSNRAVTHSRNSQYRPVILHGGQQINGDESPTATLPTELSVPAGLNPTAEEFVPAAEAAKPLPDLYSSWARQAAYHEERHASVAASRRAPCAFGAPGSAPSNEFRTSDVQTSFSFAKKGLELAVSKLLQEGMQANETSSTEGASHIPSNSTSPTSPRSISPGATQQDFSEAKLGFPPGLWQGQSPRSNRTMLNTLHGGA